MASILPVAWTIPGKVFSQDSSGYTCPLRQSGKTFQKGRLPPPSCTKTLSFHGDSQIANPSKSKPGEKKKAGLSPKMWAWLALGLAAAEDER